VDRLHRTAPRAYRSATPLASERGGVSAPSDKVTHRQYALTWPCFLAYPPRVIPACLDAEFAVNLTGGQFRAGAAVDLFCSVTNSTTDADAIANTTAGTSVVALSCPVAEVALDGATLRAMCPPFNATARCATAVRNADHTAAAAPDVVAFHVDVPCAAPAVLAAGQRIEEGACGAGAPVGTACLVACAPEYVGPNTTLVCLALGDGRSDYIAAASDDSRALGSPCTRLRAPLAPARHVTCPLARLGDRFVLCAAATCAAPVLGAGEMVVSGCADASPLGTMCVRGCAAQYEALGPTTATCTLVASHVTRWVAANATAAALAHNENEALVCTPIASLLCHSDRDCRSIDPGTVCVAVSRGAATKHRSSEELVREEMPGLKYPSGCRCSSARYTGDFCERMSMDASPLVVASGWSAAPAAGGAIAVIALVSLVAVHLRRNTPRVSRAVHKPAAQTTSMSLPCAPPLLLEGQDGYSALAPLQMSPPSPPPPLPVHAREWTPSLAVEPESSVCFVRTRGLHLPTPRLLAPRLEPVRVPRAPQVLVARGAAPPSPPTRPGLSPIVSVRDPPFARQCSWTSLTPEYVAAPPQPSIAEELTYSLIPPPTSSMPLRCSPPSSPTPSDMANEPQSPPPPPAEGCPPPRRLRPARPPAAVSLKLSTLDTLFCRDDCAMEGGANDRPAAGGPPHSSANDPTGPPNIPVSPGINGADLGTLVAADFDESSGTASQPAATRRAHRPHNDVAWVLESPFEEVFPSFARRPPCSATRAPRPLRDPRRALKCSGGDDDAMTAFLANAILPAGDERPSCTAPDIEMGVGAGGRSLLLALPTPPTTPLLLPAPFYRDSAGLSSGGLLEGEGAALRRMEGRPSAI